MQSYQMVLYDFDGDVMLELQNLPKIFKYLLIRNNRFVVHPRCADALNCLELLRGDEALK